ncbi:MAG TPA: CBS domain-containing protein [Stellaceae bacterium]|nr:CBS domain-containing protein [Stellaceae bacterium]
MKVADMMTREVELVSPEDTLQTAARIMKDIGSGALLVGKDDRIVGVLTDRDIAIRAVAAGKTPQTPVQAGMTPEVRYVFEDEDIADASQKMAGWQVRRLPVLNRSKRLVGIVSLGDLALEARQPMDVGKAMAGISRP